MANHRTDERIELAPEAPARVEYERDFYSWLMEQARLLREGRFAALDRENLAEEIESVGAEQFNKLESALRVLLTHMLKWDHQPARRSRSWALSIRGQRLELEDILTDNPCLRLRIAEAIARAYRKTRLAAIKETGLKEARFPKECPYSWDDIVGREFKR
jgi:Domain of unknown function DUF29